MLFEDQGEVVVEFADGTRKDGLKEGRLTHADLNHKLYGRAYVEVDLGEGIIYVIATFSM